MPEQNETPKAAAAFEKYYDLGEDRTLELLAQHLYQKQSKPIPTVPTILSQLKKWSAAYGWQARIIAKEQEAAEKARKKRAKRVEAMNDRHVLIGTTHQKRAIDQIERLIEAKKFGSQASVQLLKLATDLERLALGAATERTEQTGLDGSPLTAHVGYYPVMLPQKEAYPQSKPSDTDEGEQGGDA